LAKEFQQEKERAAKELQEYVEQNKELAAQLEDTRLQRDTAQQKLAETEKKLEDTIKAFNEERSRLLARIKELELEVATLKKRLAEEIANKEELARKLLEKEKELENTISESDEDKLSLLSRIKHLEDEIDTLKGDYKTELQKAERDKQDALKRENEKRQRELLEAELKRFRDLDKVRLLLTGNTKQGWLMKNGTGILGGWGKRFFVLKDHLLYWYKDESSVTSTKPLGVISCEEVRLYEIEEKESKRPYTFQIAVEMGDERNKIKVDVAASKLEEMKDWMTEIRLAKKKKLGVEAASKETPEQRKAREAAENTNKANNSANHESKS